MAERKKTGGLKEFDYSKESKKFSTKAGDEFAKSYNKWQKDKNKKKKKKSKKKIDYTNSHNFLTNIFNRSFNEYIAKHTNYSRARTLKVKSGGVKDFVYENQNSLTNAIVKLEELRDNIFSFDKLDESTISKIVDEMEKIIRNNTYDRDLIEGMWKFKKLVKKKLDIDISINIDRHAMHFYKPDSDAGLLRKEKAHKKRLNKTRREIKNSRKRRLSEDYNNIIYTIKIIFYITTIALLLIVGYAIHLIINQGEIETILDMNGTETYIEEKVITEQESIVVEENITLIKYIENPTDYDSVELKLIVYLSEIYSGDEKGGYTTYYMSDDHGNQLEIKNPSDELKKEVEDNSGSIYLVHGVFENNPFKGLLFIVSSLTISTKNIIIKHSNVTKLYNITHTRKTNNTKNVTRNTSRNKFETAFLNFYNSFFECDDGTPNLKCSKVNPFYCNHNLLVKKASKCGCPDGSYNYKDRCMRRCYDGTSHNECSFYEKKECDNGTLRFNPRKCGCPAGYVNYKGSCAQTCVDGTVYNTCSGDKPRYCSNGSIIFKSSICGCNVGFLAENEECKSIYLTGEKTITLTYILKGKKSSVDFDVYKGLNDYISGIDRSISYYYDEPSALDFVKKNIENKQQKNEIFKLVELIKRRTDNKEEQGRIAISLVQHIPYDWDGLYSVDNNIKYAYQVLYDQKGVCGEKSELLAMILSELGFGVVLFEFTLESHQAVGIRCHEEYDYLDSGYCFVESTAPSIITDSNGNYVGVGALTSKPDILFISEGIKLENVYREYKDANRLYQIEAMGSVLSESVWHEWNSIIKKYGIITE